MSRAFIFSWALVGVMGFVPLAMGQDDPPAKPVPNAFDLPSKAEPREKAGPIIKLAQPLGPEATLEERLQAKGTFQADEVPLKEFADALAAALDTSVVLAVKKLEEAAVNTETPVVCKLKNVKVQTALRLILGELELTFVTHDDVIMITTPEDAGSQLVTRVYDCRELMKLPSPIKKTKHFRQEFPATGGGSGIHGRVEAKPKEEIGPDGNYEVEDLIDVLTTSVDPDSWDEVGGPGSVSDFKGLVTVSQTQEIHERVERLLNLLHKAGGLEEKVKVSR